MAKTKKEKSIKELKKEIKQKKEDIKNNPVKIVQPTVVKMTMPQIFQSRYKQLCDETGCEIVVAPEWIKRDDGTWSMVIKTSIKQLKEPKTV